MARKHHYLPQMYLERWTSPVDPPRVPSLFVYYRGIAEPKERAPRNIAWQRGLYQVDPQVVIGGDPEALEKWFAFLEGKAKRAFDFIDLHEHLQHGEHRASMAAFLATMFLRTRKEQLAQARRSLEWVDEVVTGEVEKLGGLDTVRLLFKRFGGGPEDTTDEGLLQFLRELARRSATDRESGLVRLPTSAEKAARLFAAMNMCIALAPPLHQFVTSDSPILLPTVNEPEHWWRTHDVGISQEGVEVWCPLDPDKALLVTRKAASPTMVLDTTQMEQINHLCMRRSLEFVVTNRRRPKVAEFVAALEPIDSDGPGG